MKRSMVRLLILGLAAAAPAGRSAETHSQADPTLVAHWSFEDPDGPLCVDASGQGRDARVDPQEARLSHTHGMQGQAVVLRGNHALRASLRGTATEWKALTFSAWVRPTDLSGFREIFRQESPHRLLFSFQEAGTVLSLGLDVGGYLECDAAVRPAEILDGHWHHCAASFDGAWMRVYLDGREIGSLQRPGTLAVSPDVPAFIGSSGGSSEHFQGSLDELKLHASALTGSQVRAEYEAGTEALVRFAREMERDVGPFYPEARSFPETLAEARRRLVEQGVGRQADLAFALQARLRKAFPGECIQFTEWTGNQPSEFLTHADPDIASKLASRLVELAFEYQPLTDHQWKSQSPENLRHWKELTPLKRRHEQLVALGEPARDSKDWIELIMAAGPSIQFRPTVQEAVAPYIRPSTPRTRNLSEVEAREMLERDWLHQAGQKPTLERVRQEILWTRQLMERLALDPGHAPGFARELGQITALEQATSRDQPAAAVQELYFKVREIKRSVTFANPLLDFSRVVLVDMPFPAGSEWPHETRHRLGYMAVPGARLLVLDGLRPDGQVTQLMPQAPLHGSFWRPDVSWDGRKVLFCFKPHNEKSFHLYEIGADGTGLTQLTDGPFDDLDPIYLPDDRHLVFSTTRGNTYVRCMPPTSAFVLARCGTDGSGIYLISANNEPDYLASTMPDGRLIYTRWEYTDKPLWRAQKLWTVNPDGTQVLMYWGNQSVWPDLMKDARAIPGSRRVMFTGSAHHNWFSGSVGIVDPAQGLNFPWGLTKVTADTEWPECGNGPVDPVESARYHASGKYEAYYSPYPLGERDFLVSARRQGKFVLYLMDVDGNRELLWEGDQQALHAIPLRPRTKPPVIQDRVTWPTYAERDHPAEGVFFSSSVYEGAPPELQGKARFLRVLSIDAKTYTYWHKRPYLSTGPVVSAVQSEGVKRLLGTVPIEEDGSVSFRAPAMLPLHFQLLDDQQRALHTMRSFVHVMPGERRGCTGCHESSSRAAESRNAAIALTRPPREITPPPWSDLTVSYPRYVQPVLDRYCGKCHQGDSEGRKVLDLTVRPSSPVFPEPYLTLIGRPSWGTPYRAPDPPPPGFGIAGMLMVEAYGTVDPQAYTTSPPMTALSYRSRLIELATNGKHYDVKVDEISRQRLIAWVDAMCPYLGDDEIREIPDPQFQGIDWLAVRPKVATAPRLIRPGPLDAPN